MSQYIHFFVRSTDRLLPIRTTSRSSSIYRFFSDYAPYEKVRALSMQELQNIREEINTQIDEWTRHIEEDRTNLQLRKLKSGKIPKINHSAKNFRKFSGFFNLKNP